MRLFHVQLAGSYAVIVPLSLAELSAAALRLAPGSEVLWRLDLGLFGFVEHVRASHAPARLLFGPCTLPLSIVCLAAAIVIQCRGWRLAAAAVANLCFLFCAGLLEFGAGAASPAAGLGTGVGRAAGSVGWDYPVAALMMAGACVAFLASHASFAGRILAEAGRARPSGDRRPAVPGRGP